jgi:hypothetical protein
MLQPIAGKDCSRYITDSAESSEAVRDLDNADGRSPGGGQRRVHFFD